MSNPTSSSTTSSTKFADAINAGYTFKGASITLGGAMHESKNVTGVLVKAPLSMMNRHGLIAGATGTGKTKSIQRLIESLSENGVPSLVLDIKGDVSGLSKPGTTNPKIEDRSKLLGIPWEAKQFPVEFLTISKSVGVKMRATVTEFGPNLFAKMFELNDTQEGAIAMIFKYCDDKGLALVDLADLKSVLQYLGTEAGRADVSKDYGNISESTTGTILRKVVELESQGGDLFFGETSFDAHDLARTDSSGKGYINIMRVADLQTNPKLFSTFMLALLAEIYSTFPEEGDIEKPKLCLFIDEAHLLFDQASSALLSQIEMIVKLIRSKGIGVYFITQNPTDIPESVLAQLGLKIQHALRAFTANDRKAIKQASENYPLTDFYQVDELITSLGIGEAIITVLDERGNPTPLVHSMMLPPQTRMDTITDQELNEAVVSSNLAGKYNQTVDRESAADILNKRIADNQIADAPQNAGNSNSDIPNQKEDNSKQDPTFIEGLSQNTMVRQIGRTLTAEVTRGIMGMLGLKRRR
jgi:uncharacterized protein